MLNSGPNRWFFVPCDLESSWMTLKNNMAPLPCCFKLCASFHSHQWMQTKVRARKRSMVKMGNFFFPCDLEIWRMTSKNNRAPFLCFFKLCASFRRHWWIETGVTDRKRQNWIKIDDFFSRVTLKFEEWLWTRQIWGIWKLRPAYNPETPNLGQNWCCFVPCDLEIWWMTLDNNRAPLLCCFKLCATFHSHRWIQTAVAVRKRPIWVKFDDFYSRVTLKFDVWPWKTIGHLYYATSSSMHHFVAIGEFKLESESGNTQFGSTSMIFWAVWPCNMTYDLEKQ